MRECFGAIPATDEGFIRRLYRTRPEVLRRILLPLLTPQSAAIRRLEEILAEEDEAELVRSNDEWLDLTKVSTSRRWAGAIVEDVERSATT